MAEPCPHCDRDDFGNPGARTQHVRACREKAKKYTDGDGSAAAEPQVVKAEPQQQSPPAARSGESAGAGESLATGLAAATDQDAPIEQRKEATKNIAELAGGLLSGFMEYQSTKESRQEQRAKQSGVEAVSDKPTCECGAVFSGIPENADRIQCAHCGREYRVTS